LSSYLSFYSSLARSSDALLARSSKVFLRAERGVSLVEVTLATGLLGLSLAAVLQAFAALGLATGRLDRAAVAEGVAHSVAESILNQTYQNYPGTYSTSTDVANPRSYTVVVQVEYASDPATVTQATPATFTSTPATDHGLQRISVTVTSLQGGDARTTRVLKHR